MMTIVRDEKEIEVFAVHHGSHVDFCLRAKDRATWDQVALKYGLLVSDEPEGVLDKVLPVRLKPVSGEPAPGVHINHIGPVTLTPATYDENGEVVTAAKMDNRHHINLRLTKPILHRRNEAGNLAWEEILLDWMQNGKEAKPNNEERSKTQHGVELLDATSISNPTRVWL